MELLYDRLFSWELSTTMSYVVNLPLYLVTGVRKKKNNWLTLNNYRNWQYRVSNNLKRLYTAQVGKEIKDLPVLKPPIRLTYDVHYVSNRRFDLDNYGAVASKFFQDTLVTFHKLPDDDYDNVVEVVFRFGGVDKENPRIECTIEEV